MNKKNGLKSWDIKANTVMEETKILQTGRLWESSAETKMLLQKWNYINYKEIKDKNEYKQDFYIKKREKTSGWQHKLQEYTTKNSVFLLHIAKKKKSSCN